MVQILVHFKMDDKDKIIAKLKKENEYLKSLLQMHNISFEKPKEIKRHLIDIVTVGERQYDEVPSKIKLFQNSQRRVFI